MHNFPADFPFQAINLLFLIVPVVKAIIDSRLQLSNKEVNHKRSILLFMILGAALAFIDFKISPVRYYLQSCFLGVTYFWLLFDYLRNFLVGKPIMYIDEYPDSDPEEDSWFDTNIYSKLGPLGTLGVKLWVSLFGIISYYYFSYVNYF